MESTKITWENRSTFENIDEVFPRMFMSNHNSATHLETLRKHGITHILCVENFTEKPFESEGI